MPPSRQPLTTANSPTAEMHHHHRARSPHSPPPQRRNTRHTPQPDIVPPTTTHYVSSPRTHRATHQRHEPPTFSPNTQPPSPPTLIIALFALRLTHTLISHLPAYPSQRTDLHWLSTFLARIPAHYALAKIRGARREEYLEVYPRIVSGMKSQRMFPRVFGVLDPARTGAEGEHGGMTDCEFFFVPSR